jgi:hypothetical protein
MCTRDAQNSNEFKELQDAKKMQIHWNKFREEFKRCKFIGTNSSFQNFTPLETVWKYNAAGY